MAAAFETPAMAPIFDDSCRFVIVLKTFDLWMKCQDQVERLFADV